MSEASKTARFMKSRSSGLTTSIYKSLSDNYSLLERDLVGKVFKTKPMSENPPTPRVWCLVICFTYKNHSHYIFSCDHLLIQLNIMMPSEGRRKKMPFLSYKLLTLKCNIWSKFHTRKQNSLNYWINRIWQLIIVAGFESEPMRGREAESDWG